MTNDLAPVFDKLRAHYGSHCSAARNLGVTPDYYRALRNGRSPLTQRMSEYILLKSQALDFIPKARETRHE